MKWLDRVRGSSWSRAAAAGPRWCHSPWAVIGASALLILGAAAGGGAR